MPCSSYTNPPVQLMLMYECTFTHQHLFTGTMRVQTASGAHVIQHTPGGHREGSTSDRLVWFAGPWVLIGILTELFWPPPYEHFFFSPS